MSLSNSLVQDDFGFKPFQSQQNQQVSEPVKDDEFGFKPFQQNKTQLQQEQALIDEDLDPEIERHIARFTSRGLEQVGGAPGNIRDMAYAIKDIFSKQKPLIPGMKAPIEPDSFKKIEEAIPIGQTVSTLLGYLPTSSQLKKKSEELTKGFTTPQTETERIGDEVWEKVVSSALPGQGPRNIWRNIAAPIAGTLGKEFVKKIGGSEKEQALTEVGLGLAIPLMTGNAPQLNRDVWKNVNSTVPNANISTWDMLKKADDLAKRIKQGLGSRSETEALSTLNKLTEKLKTGNITAKELMASNKSLNEIVGDPALFGRGAHLFEEIRSIIKDGMSQVGKEFPDWLANWKKANEIHGAIANSNYVANLVSKRTAPLASEGARALFGGAMHATAKTAAAVPPIYAVYKGTQILDRMSRSPQLMRYYTQVVTNSIRGNVAAAADSLDKLDNALLKEEKKGKPPLKNSSPKKSQTSRK